MRRLVIGIIAGFVLLATTAGVVVKVRGQNPLQRWELNADQGAAIERNDKAMLELQRQAQALIRERNTLLAGFALSNPEIAKIGLDKIKYSDKDGKKCFERLTEAEIQAARDAAAKAAPAEQQ